MPFKLPKGFSVGQTKKGKAPKKTAMTLRDAAATAKALDKLDASGDQGQMAYKEGKGGKNPLQGARGYGR